jgi:ubiquinone/menaquinone biosynthesis C-methylase UbiE
VVRLAASFDVSWQERYQRGRALARYPYDAVVHFVYRYGPEQPRDQTVVLEVGCGAGNNLWFAAREGFRVAGIDGSDAAIAYARERFEEDGLGGDLRVGDFTQLPFDSESVDLAIDRAAITCLGLTHATRAVAEVHRVLRPGGRFLLNPYSTRADSLASGRPGPDGLTLNIRSGALAGMEQILPYDRQTIDAVLGDGWRLLSLQHVTFADECDRQFPVHAEWRVVAEKR